MKRIIDCKICDARLLPSRFQYGCCPGECHDEMKKKHSDLMKKFSKELIPKLSKFKKGSWRRDR